MQKDEDLAWIHEQIDTYHCCNQSSLNYIDAQVENIPAEEIARVFETHHLHSFSWLWLLFFSKFWHNIVKWYQKSEHDEEWELLTEPLGSKRINRFILWSFHWHVCHIESCQRLIILGSNDCIRYERIQWADSDTLILAPWKVIWSFKFRIVRVEESVWNVLS